jgi:hypothetical protein
MAALNVDVVSRPAPVPSETRTKTSFNVGTRKSALALVQTELVVEALKKAWPDHEFQIHARDTAAGDIDKVTPFKDMLVKNLWTHELEQLLIENKLDLLVHSLKGKPLTNTDLARQRRFSIHQIVPAEHGQMYQLKLHRHVSLAASWRVQILGTFLCSKLDELPVR